MDCDQEDHSVEGGESESEVARALRSVINQKLVLPDGSDGLTSQASGSTLAQIVYVSGRRFRLPDNDMISPDQVMSALKRYLEASSDTEEAVASQIGVNHHTLRRWLTEKQSPKKEKLALTASFLRRAGYL